jgi:hypothetical protein
MAEMVYPLPSMTTFLALMVMKGLVFATRSPASSYEPGTSMTAGPVIGTAAAHAVRNSEMRVTNSPLDLVFIIGGQNRVDIKYCVRDGEDPERGHVPEGSRQD